jgi:hypothetical protein
METEINIAEILKDKPTGTSLWSITLAKCTLQGVDNNGAYPVCVRSKNTGDLARYSYKGRWNEGIEDSECVLFPSKEMRDWSKFAWKKGDVLVNKDRDTHVIFEEFTDDTYTTFTGKHYRSKISKNGYEYVRECSCATEEFTLEAENAAQTYIKTIEEKLGGKLNRDTLEIDKQPEFKDGDIAFADYGNRQDVFIVSDKTGLSEGYSSFISLDLSSLTLSMGYRTCFFKKDLCKLRLATEEEKQQLFDALEKKSKAWDAEKKQIVDLKPKCEFKPFDKVLGRNEKDAVWEAELFSHYKEESQYPFRCIGFSRKYCIPYNKETAHLLGTTDDWEGGEQ